MDPKIYEEMKRMEEEKRQYYAEKERCDIAAGVGPMKKPNITIDVPTRDNPARMTRIVWNVCDEVFSDEKTFRDAFAKGYYTMVQRIVEQKLNEQMAEIEKFFQSVNLTEVIAGVLATEITRQLVVGRLIGPDKGQPASSGGVASGAIPGAPALSSAAAQIAQLRKAAIQKTP